MLKTVCSNNVKSEHSWRINRAVAARCNTVLKPEEMASAAKLTGIKKKRLETSKMNPEEKYDRKEHKDKTPQESRTLDASCLAEAAQAISLSRFQRIPKHKKYIEKRKIALL